MPVFTPEVLFSSVTHITPEYLQSRGISALVLDVDNTLAPHGSQTLAPDIAAWLDTMKAAGVYMMIASNNTEKRVAPFAQKLGLEHASFCCKPLPRWLMEAKRRWGLPKEQVAIVGDQIFTDALAGHMAGVKVLLVRPLVQDTTPTLRFKRRLEAPFLAKYYRRGGTLL